MTTSEDIANLVEEYKSILGPANCTGRSRRDKGVKTIQTPRTTRTLRTISVEVSHDPDKVEKLLVAEGEWTSSAAEHLVRLSKEYGSFMLRNALALALALEIEDGSLGF